MIKWKEKLKPQVHEKKKTTTQKLKYMSWTGNSGCSKTAALGPQQETGPSQARKTAQEWPEEVACCNFMCVIFRLDTKSTELGWGKCRVLKYLCRMPRSWMEMVWPPMTQSWFWSAQNPLDMSTGLLQKTSAFASRQLIIIHYPFSPDASVCSHRY